MSGALIYIRVSTEEQQRRNVANLPTQEKKAREHGSRHGVPILKVFSDEESGRTPAREGLQRLLDYCREHRGKVSHVIVTDLSRLSRNVADQGTLMGRLAGMGITLLSVDEPHIDRTAAGKLSANLLGSVNQFYSDILSERVRYRMAETVKLGRFPHRAPLGYRNVQMNGTKNVAIDAERAPMIRKAFELLATGSYKTDAVLRAVNAMGLRTVRGSPVTPQSFSQMIRNPLYMGWIHSGENKVKGNFEALVNEELFITVQDVLNGKRVPVPHKRVNEDFPLAKFVKCAKCDRPLTAGWAKGRGGKKYARYWCYNKTCKRMGISREGLEGAFVQLLAMMQPTADLMARLPDIAESNWKVRSKRIEDEKRTLQTRLNENRAMSLRAIEARIKGELSADDLDQFKAANDKSIADLEEQLRTLQSECFTMEQLLADARRSVVNLARTWLKADIERRHEIQTALFPDGLRFSPDSLFFEPRNHTLMQAVSELVTALINDGRGERI
ncbi:MAG: recombinase family protein [Acidobacteriia bacterium]|nr:recombinase family protein [Terriglobia bacterium]